MKKTLILVAGPPASGKNRVSAELARGLGHAAVIDKDDLCPLVSRIFDLTGNERDMDGIFCREHIHDAEYETLLLLARSALAYEDCAIANAPFGREIRDPVWLSALRDSLREDGAALAVLFLLADPACCHERMLLRGAERDRKKLADYDSYASGVRYEPPAGIEDAVDLLAVIDVREPAAHERTLADALRKLKEE